MKREIHLMPWQRYSRMLTLICNKRGDMKQYADILWKFYFAKMYQDFESGLSFESAQYTWNKGVKFFTRLP